MLMLFNFLLLLIIKVDSNTLNSISYSNIFSFANDTKLIGVIRGMISVKSHQRHGIKAESPAM